MTEVIPNSGGGEDYSNCREQIIYFNPARRQAKKKKYYMFI